MSSIRYAAAWCLLVLAALALATPLVASDPCDEPCGTHCGDCASCPLAADLHVAPVPFGEITAGFSAVLEIPKRSEFPRALDHVPLRA
jgi:hypothetical protein